MMRRISSFGLFLLTLWVFFHPWIATASMPTSFRQPHPLNWSHATPVGEMPGWSGNVWMFFEVSNANVWNAPFRMTDTRTGESYEYHADYEQASAILELGGALSDNLAFSLEVPYAYRGGGFLDNVIDEYHVLIGNRRFNRHYYEENQSTYSTATGGVQYYDSENRLHAVSNFKPKLKWWLWKKIGSKNSCPCGLSVSTQVKVPIQDEKFGGTTGRADYSGLLHFGLPLGTNSAFWFTGAYTRLSHDPGMKGWPLSRDHQMYELSLDLALSNSWGLLFQMRTQSPFLKKKYLKYEETSSDPEINARDRAASGWNSLVHWQGAQGFGLRYRNNNFQINLIFAEDFGAGKYDTTDGIYSNNAPDFNAIVQTSLHW